MINKEEKDEILSYWNLCNKKILKRRANELLQQLHWRTRKEEWIGGYKNGELHHHRKKHDCN